MWDFSRTGDWRVTSFVDSTRLDRISSTSSVVEPDGGQHAEQTHYEDKRTHFLESTGYRVVRYWDHEMLLDSELVLDDVFDLFHRLSPHLGPLPMGEEDSSFTLFQVRGAVAEDVTKRPKDNCLLCKILSKSAQAEHSLSKWERKNLVLSPKFVALSRKI